MANVAAHLILGGRPEPFLGALLASLEGVVQRVIVNDNAADASMHALALESAWCARDGALVVDRTPFSDFSSARNICLELHRKYGAGEWVAFVDADDVHGREARTIASHLDRVPEKILAVDGYNWHFFQAFDLYTSIERRMMFFRFDPALRWVGKVHERLVGCADVRTVLPYVYPHYGHVLPVRRFAEKGRHYSSLGQPGEVVPEEELDHLESGIFFAEFWSKLLRFRGKHPEVAAAAIATLRAELAQQERVAHEMVRASQTLAVRIQNALRQANYNQRWVSRWLNPLAWQLLR
ncbi:MAG: hypothetical protein JO165_04745 [Candidatus Eremiobacteraeota bacterium]|nr:hypothetical protein [Candidatus Eremiobacteraeota bacterium]